MKKETFVLIHSAWLGAWQWQEVKKVLEAEGHEVITLTYLDMELTKHNPKTLLWMIM